MAADRKELMILSPFGLSDRQSVREATKAGAFGILRVESNGEEIGNAIERLSSSVREPFGVYFSGTTTGAGIDLPENVTKIVLPFGSELKISNSAEIIHRVSSCEEARQAVAQQVSAIAIREDNGVQGGARERIFDIFRAIVDPAQKNGTKIYIQGDTGPHTAAAFLALGAHGIIFDSPLACFPECKFSAPEGGDTDLARELAGRYGNLRSLVAAVREATHGHVRQAKYHSTIDFDVAPEKTKESTVTGGEPFAPLALWEKQIMSMLRKEKNLSKYALIFSDEVCDPFFAAFVSVMAASVAARGIRVRISTGIPGGEERKTLRKLQPSVENLLSCLPDIPPVVPVAHRTDIAVIGMDCIYPGAANVDEYWRNILSGRDCVSEIPASHWDQAALFRDETADTDYSLSKWGGFIAPVDFDPIDFGIVPRSLFMTEPSHLLSLLVTRRALKDAGYDDPARCDLENTSVFFGANSTSNPLVSKLHARFQVKQTCPEHIPEALDKAFPRANEYSFAGVLSNLLTGRIANRLNLGGRNYTVDAACASSLASLDIACQELSTHRADMVVYGGADLTNTYGPYLMFSSVRVLSPRGLSAPFDADADGIVLGEGVGAMILKRLEDAERDGDKIYAVIRGIGGGSDGRNLGLMAPSRKGEGRAIERAWRHAGMPPSRAGLIEAHGTGTVVGDRVELATLTELMLDAGALPGESVIGSVKSQIGHTKCAAGVGALIKAVLAVRHGVIPSTHHLEKPNPYYHRPTSPFVFHRRAGVWNDTRRVAGISAFGFGGTNFHAVVENYGLNLPEAASCAAWPAELFVFRGDTIEEARSSMEKIKRLIAQNDALRPIDLAYTLAVYNDKPVQVSIVASDLEELIAKMNAALEGRNDIRIRYRNVRPGGVAFLFPGQGSQRVDMARDLFVAFPSMRRLLEKYGEYTRILFPETAFDPETRAAQERAVVETTNAQPLLGIVDLAIAEHLRFLGIEPDAVAGHSYGELPALCFAGALSPDELIALSRARAGAIRNALGEDRGKMAVVLATEAELPPLLEGETEVWAVNYNSPKQIVLSGTSRGIESLLKKAAARQVICKTIDVDCAFHSPLVAGASKAYADALHGIGFRAPEIPVWGHATAAPYPEEAEAIRAMLADHLIRPLRFDRQIEKMYESGVRIFIETGPGRVLSALTESILGNRVSTIQTESKVGDGITDLLRALGYYLALGKSFHIEKLFAGRGAVRLDPDRPEQHQKSPTAWRIDGSGVYPAGKNTPIGTGR